MKKRLYDPVANKVINRRKKSVFNTQEQRLQQDKEYRERVISGINKAYSSAIISQSVRDTELDRAKFKENQFDMSPSAKRAIYDKYNLAYYPNYMEFKKAKEAYYMSDTQVKALWVEYEHRDKLIISGQYEELRLRVFKENYIKGLRRLGMTDKEIAQIEDLDENEFGMLMMPIADKTNINKTRLPELGMFTYNDIESLKNTREELNKAFKDVLNKDFTYEEKDSRLTSKVKKLYKYIKTDDRDDIDDTNENTEYYSMIDLFPAGKIKESKPNKYGQTYYYIPFMGSERTSEMVRDIVHRKRKMKEL